VTAAAGGAGRGTGDPRILVFSTQNVSDPGVDLAGSAHLDYPTKVRVISLPCSSGINPLWVLHALESGFDGVFVAADGGDCSKIANCTERTGKVVAQAQELLRGAGFNPARIKMAAICSVCSESFVSHMRKFTEQLAALPARAAPAPSGPAIAVEA
jgi:F420-non-reducing hydrogenase iron-sulfur subunit